jgi:hypothetical protein
MKTKNQLAEVRKQLKRGDIKKIADLIGFHRVTIARMFNGENKYEMHPLVWEAAQIIIDKRRKELAENIQESIN